MKEQKCDRFHLLKRVEKGRKCQAKPLFRPEKADSGTTEKTDVDITRSIVIHKTTS